MKIERLRNKKSKLIFLCGALLVVVLLITVVVKGSKAKYRNSQIIPLINTKVKNNVPSFTTMGIFVKNSSGGYEERDILPSEEGYIINESKSSCTKFNPATNTSEPVTGVKIYTDTLGKHVIEGIKKGYKCYIYLDKGFADPTSIKTQLLTKWGYSDITTITERTDIGALRTDTGNKVYKAEDNDGWSYYLVGNPTNNWVKFGGYYWRIVRINGDGTLRMIYQGRTKDESGTNLAPQATGAETQIKTSPYNPNGKAEYVGYWYKLGEHRGLSTPSTIYGVVNEFYTKIGTETDRNYIDKNASFCNDRTISQGSTGYGDVEIYFGHSRYYSDYKCSSDLDLFTSKSASKGNKILQYPIGLITREEVWLGGIRENEFETGSNMYFTERDYWTMTPGGTWRNYVDKFEVYVYFVAYQGFVTGIYWSRNNNVYNSYGVRPVINLVKNITFSKGNGTSSNPFEI